MTLLKKGQDTREAVRAGFNNDSLLKGADFKQVLRMERHVGWAFMYFAFALSMPVRAMTILRLEHGNIYLLIAFSFVSIVSIFLCVCYFTPLFSKKWIKWLSLIIGCVLLFSGIAEIILVVS